MEDYQEKETSIEDKELMKVWHATEVTVKLPIYRICGYHSAEEHATATKAKYGQQ